MAAFSFAGRFVYPDDRVEVHGGRRWPLLTASLVHTGFVARMQPHLRNIVCSSPEMQAFLSPRVTAVYNYRLEDGSPLASIRIAPRHCAKR